MTKRILITGATSGMGYQLAIDYLHAGCVVYAVGRNHETLNELSDLGAIPINVDLTDHQQVMRTLANITSLDIVICCAGVCQYIDIIDEVRANDRSDNGLIPLDTLNNKTLNLSKLGFDSLKIMQVMNSNFNSLIYSIEAVLPALKKTQGRLVALGSASAYVPFARAEAYGSSKAAIHYLMQTLQISLKPHGIKVSLVIPGFVETPMTDRNNFEMPFLQTPKQASHAIRQGIDNGQDIIAFPKHLTIPLKALGILPSIVWQFVSNKLYNRLS